MKASFVRLSVFVFVFASLALGELSQAQTYTQIQAYSQSLRPPLPIPPETEIQIFVDYEKRRDRGQKDLKVVSTARAPRSLEYLYFEHYETPTNAACYWGDPKAAEILLNEMTALFNLERNRRVQVEVTPFYAEEIKKMALHIVSTDEWNQKTELFPRMRECNRRSTPDERRN